MTRRRRPRHEARREHGQVVVAFAILPVVLALGAIVITLGNWYMHARHLQTKVDAAAFAGGARIPVRGRHRPPDRGARTGVRARTFRPTARPRRRRGNPQVGGVPGSNVHVVLNGSQWYDNDSNPFPLGGTVR